MLTVKMQMERIFEYTARYCCRKCHKQWISKSSMRNRPTLCKVCGMPAYPIDENLCSFFHVPRYRSISHLLTK